MKRIVMTLAMMCLMAMSSKAQIYDYDTAVQMPTMDLYDTGMMIMYARALAETAARRQAAFERYYDLAIEACGRKEWSDVVYYVNNALETKYYTGGIYFLRGYAYEQMGKLRTAKKDYKKGKKYNSLDAARALEALKAKNRRR